MTRTSHAPACARPNPEAMERTVIHQTAEAGYLTGAGRPRFFGRAPA